MKKVLFVATVTGHINAFHTPYLKLFKDNGYKTEVISNGDAYIPYCDVHYDVPTKRNPIDRDNIKAYKMIKNIVNAGQYDTIHCHTPVAAMLLRLAAQSARKRGTRVIYTAHGFHFFKGAPLKNWLLYFPVEWLCSFYTDILITINKEDFAFAKKHLHAKQICYVPGVGVDIDRFKNTKVDIDKKREELGCGRIK